MLVEQDVVEALANSHVLLIPFRLIRYQMLRDLLQWRIIEKKGRLPIAIENCCSSRPNRSELSEFNSIGRASPV